VARHLVPSERSAQAARRVLHGQGFAEPFYTAAQCKYSLLAITCTRGVAAAQSCRQCPTPHAMPLLQAFAQPSAQADRLRRPLSSTLGRTSTQTMPLPPDPSSPWFFVFFVAMWLAVTGLLAFVSGWFSLATRWRAQGSASGERFRMRSATLGAKFLPVSYGNCLTVTVSEQGLGLSIFLLFRLLSPPLFIPWSEISSVSEGRFLFFRHVVVQPTSHWSRIKLYGAVGSKVLAASRGRTSSAA